MKKSHSKVDMMCISCWREISEVCLLIGPFMVTIISFILHHVPRRKTLVCRAHFRFLFSIRSLHFNGDIGEQTVHRGAGRKVVVVMATQHIVGEWTDCFWRWQKREIDFNSERTLNKSAPFIQLKIATKQYTFLKTFGEKLNRLGSAFKCSHLPLVIVWPNLAWRHHKGRG